MDNFSQSFDFEEGQRQKNEGMDIAADHRTKLLEEVREAVKQIALARKSREATADDASKWLYHKNPKLSLGPAAGSIFKTKDWRFTGRRILSEKVANHAREIKVWYLI